MTSPSEQSSGKGRPTRSRREATAGRKQGLSGNRDPRAARQRQREARAQARAGLMAGDSRYFPARDRGPVREFVRDYVDARRSAGEFFVVGAVIVMVLGLVRVPVVQQAVVLGWTATLALVIVDTTYLGIQLTRALRRFERAQRRGAMPYGLLRALQMRRFRIPPPRVGPGGRPVTPRTRK